MDIEDYREILRFFPNFFPLWRLRLAFPPNAPAREEGKKGKSLKRVSGESFTVGEGVFRVKLKPKRIIDQGVGNCQVFKKVW